MQTINKYFPDLTPVQQERFAALDALYRDWNSKINVISRKDMDSLYLHHVLHSLAIAKAVQFEPGSTVLDVGTGGGFPGIPLAILFPEVKFTLCDSIGKKIKVASSVAESLGLDNVCCVNARVETLPDNYDYIVSRAVTNMTDFYGWIRGRWRKSLICLKGGDVEEEIAACAARHRLNPAKFTICDVSLWFEEEFFEGKKMVIMGQ
ncbi:MAG: 16S rRNA (guanine(527)-N(7))-methyltransferase RsmG [Bacteroidales bacterium]|nr:16S rRNA (guanine(527)-N(7))-methyltransferase RsmG [Bacteroidales bacterium]